jgi:hypothetical protein
MDYPAQLIHVNNDDSSLMKATTYDYLHANRTSSLCKWIIGLIFLQSHISQSYNYKKCKISGFTARNTVLLLVPYSEYFWYSKCFQQIETETIWK